MPDDSEPTRHPVDRRALTLLVMTVVLSLLGNALTPYLREKTSLSGSVAKSLDCFLCGLLIAEFLSVSWLMIPLQLSMISGAVVRFALPVFYSMSMVLGCRVWPGMPLGAAVFFLIAGFATSIGSGLFHAAALHLSRCRWEHAQRGPLKLAPQGGQFGIGLLFALMVLSAVGIAIWKAIMPDNKAQWLPAFEFLILASWFVGLILAASLEAEVIARLILGVFSFYRLVGAVVLLLVGPFLFQLIASACLSGHFAFQLNSTNIWMAYGVCCGMVVGNVIIFIPLRLLGYRINGTMGSDLDLSNK